MKPQIIQQIDDTEPPPSIGERRYLTVLFSDLSDSTLLGVKLESEHYFALLAALRQIFRAVISKFGGRVARVQGDGVLAIFGYPIAQEDDGRRATDAALELHSEVQLLQFGSPPGFLINPSRPSCDEG